MRDNDGVGAIPKDVGELFGLYEAVSGKRREVLDDALTAFQVSIEQSDQMPSLALMALWTALERISGWDQRCVRIGRKRLEAAIEAGRKNTSAPQEAILEMAKSMLGMSSGLAELAEVLQRARTIRNVWAHYGRLGGRDLSETPEVWVAQSERQSPAWAQLGGLLETTAELFGRLVISALEATRQ